MRKASRAMYIVGTIVNWIGLIAGIILLIVGVLISTGVLASAASAGDADTAGAAGAVYAAYLINGIVLLITQVPILFLAHFFKNGGMGWQIAAIILGVYSGNAFFILGGIFGCVAGGNK